MLKRLNQPGEIEWTPYHQEKGLVEMLGVSQFLFEKSLLNRREWSLIVYHHLLREGPGVGIDDPGQFRDGLILENLFRGELDARFIGSANNPQTEQRISP